MRKFNEGELELFGQGDEKKVYSIAEDPSRLVVRPKSEKERFGSENALKARFYLTRIVHMLFPKNIPDMHFAESGSDTLVVERKYLDAKHNAVRNIKIGRADNDKGRYAAVLLHQDRVSKDPRRQELIDELKKLKIPMDSGLTNYGFDAEGNIVYVEDLPPWKLSVTGRVIPYYDKNKLEEAIETLPPNQRKRALSYLERLEKLYEAEAKWWASLPHEQQWLGKN